MVDRYNAFADEVGGVFYDEQLDGEVVKYEDYAKLEAENIEIEDNLSSIDQAYIIVKRLRMAARVDLPSKQLYPILNDYIKLYLCCVDIADSLKGIEDRECSEGAYETIQAAIEDLERSL